MRLLRRVKPHDLIIIVEAKGYFGGGSWWNVLHVIKVNGKWAFLLYLAGIISTGKRLDQLGDPVVLNGKLWLIRNEQGSLFVRFVVVHVTLSFQVGNTTAAMKKTTPWTTTPRTRTGNMLFGRLNSYHPMVVSRLMKRCTMPPLQMVGKPVGIRNCLDYMPIVLITSISAHIEAGHAIQSP